MRGKGELNQPEMHIFNTLDTLQKRAKAPVGIKIVRTLGELQKEGVKFKGEHVEAVTVRDKRGTPKQVYFVLENLKDASHATRVWLHNQVGHYGLIDTLKNSGIETKDFLNATHDLLRTTKEYEEIAEAYAEDVKGMSTEDRRAYLTEEVLAQRAESLNLTERKAIYQRFKDLINNWLKKVFGITTDIQITDEDVGSLLETAKNRVMFGEERAWLEFKHSNKTYKKWAKEIRKKFSKAYHWYDNHQKLVKQTFGNDADIFNALLALTSAGAAVRDNSTWAIDTYLFLNGKRNKPGGRFPNEMKKKLDKLLNGEFVYEAMQSPSVKVPEFIRALLGDEKATVNDRWMYRAFFGNSKLTTSLIEKHREDLTSLDSLFNLSENTAARHKLFELVKELTDETGEKWTPRDLQAAIWMHVASEEKEISPADEWDYEKGLTTPSNKYGGLTPIEYLRKEMGDTPIGQLHQKIRTGNPERVSRLEKMYVQYLKKQGVKQIERYSTVPESMGMGIHYKATELKKGDFILATDREGRVRHNNYSMSDIGNRLAAHTEKNPYAPLVHFYEAGTKPESQLKGKPHVYTIDPKDYKIYDSITDALGLRWETEKRLKRDKGASETNILANLIKEEGYDGFIANSPYGKGRWILAFEKAAVKHLPTTVDVGISDVVESMEALPQDVGKLKKMLGKRNTDFYRRITKAKENYPEVTVEGFNPTIAQFKEATSDVLEIGGALRLTGPLPSIKAFVSEVAIEHGQRQVYVMQPKKDASDLMVKFKVKPTLKTVEDVQKALTKHGITDFNIVIKRDTGSIFIEQYLWDQKVVDKFLKMMKDVAHPGFPLNTVYDAESEILGDDDFGLAPEKFKEHLVKYFGEKNGEKIYEKAIQRREDYFKRLSGETGQKVRYSRSQGETPERPSQDVLQKITGKKIGKQPVSFAKTYSQLNTPKQFKYKNWKKKNVKLDRKWREHPNIRFKRASSAPKNTVKAYKLFRTLKSKPGKIFPLFIGNKKEVPVGEWMEAEHIPTKGFAPRPGWHAGVTPKADHLSKKGRVWAEVEIPADVDWQLEADKQGRYGKNGQWIPGDIKDRVPKGGHYRFPVNANQGAEWIISGALKVNRILSQEEVDEINREGQPGKPGIHKNIYRTYHGTTAKGFTKFKTPAWFGTTEEANLYANTRPEGGRIIPVDLTIKNPLIAKDRTEMREVLGEKDVTGKEDYSKGMMELSIKLKTPLLFLMQIKLSLYYHRVNPVSA
jgi:hypothetical protein